jgi:hypothetical protein
LERHSTAIGATRRRCSPVLFHDGIYENGSLSRDLDLAFVEFDVQMMRGSIAIVNEMEF